MKLLQLLAKELKEWPEDGGPVAAVVQDPDRTAYVRPHDDADEFAFRQNEWIGVWHNSATARPLSGLATDHATAIVTRADWEAEKARIAGKVDGGWRRHKGVKQPVADGVKVEIRTRGGDFEVCSADGFAWGANGAGQIMAYRIHKPAEQPAPVSEEVIVEDKSGNLSGLTVPHHMLFGYASKEEMREATGCESLQEAVQMIAKDAGTFLPGALESVSGPLEWRNRIRYLDTQRAELEATYQRQIGEIDGERASLVGKLAQEGLALVEVAVQAVEDMSDPVNWRKGDLITFVEEAKDRCFTTGKQYVFEDLDGYGSAGVLADDEGDENGWAVEYFKWHSRPGK